MPRGTTSHSRSRGLHRHRACASLSIDSTTDPEEPVGTRYETRGYLIVATSISSNNLAGLQGHNGLRERAGRNRIYERRRTARHFSLARERPVLAPVQERHPYAESR